MARTHHDDTQYLGDRNRVVDDHPCWFCIGDAIAEAQCFTTMPVWFWTGLYWPTGPVFATYHVFLRAVRKNVVLAHATLSCQHVGHQHHDGTNVSRWVSRGIVFCGLLCWFLKFHLGHPGPPGSTSLSYKMCSYTLPAKNGSRTRSAVVPPHGAPAILRYALIFAGIAEYCSHGHPALWIAIPGFPH